MACPYFSRVVRRTKPMSDSEDEFSSSKSQDDLNYGSYLQLDKILNAQKMRSGLNGCIPMHDEHLFIITHQAFELWFQQILHEIDSIRSILMVEYLEERNSLCVISRLNRVIAILKLCCEQFGVLETMTPQDFLDFRETLEGASGFQSLQFRMIEIRLGVIEDLRISYNKEYFMNVFADKERLQLQQALSEPSLQQLVDNWLSRTPGLKHEAFNFWNKFKVSVQAMLQDMKISAEEETNARVRDEKLMTYNKSLRNFTELFDEDFHNNLLMKNERRFTYQAMQGSLMIFLYRDEPRLHLPFQLLQSLMELDAQFMKLRYNHTSMVQRMVGNKLGTGGSSGYFYLRSTCSDRYKIFLDLLNMASYLVPRDRIPPLSSQMKMSLSIHDNNNQPACSGHCWEEADSGCHSCSLRSFPITEEDTGERSSRLCDIDYEDRDGRDMML